MKTFITLLFALTISGMATTTAGAADKLYHVVSFKFKATAGPDEVKKVEEAFQALKKKIPQVAGFEWGTNVSKEKFDKGFTHCFVLTFKSEKDRDAYIEHPEHKAFVQIGMPAIDDVFVIDFWSKR